MRELQPVNQNVILEVDDAKGEQKTASGIIIPDTVEKERPKTGKVIALSNIENPEVAVGDVVLFKDYTGTEVTLDNDKYLVMPYADILAKIVETEAI
jgi:chaperonin GroES